MRNKQKHKHSQHQTACNGHFSPKGNRCAKKYTQRPWAQWLFPAAGLASLLWFLLRVIPKPTRATYPCQRVAFPLASGFIAWLIAAACSVKAFHKAKRHFHRRRYVLAAMCVVLSLAAAFLAISAAGQKPALAVDPTPNAPIGLARGVNPGRVVWAHDPNATDWVGPDYEQRWWEAISQTVVDDMLSQMIRLLAEKPTDGQAWEEIFRHFNNTKGKGDIGYQSGEKIMIKLNLVGLHFGWHNVDPNGDQIVGIDDWGGIVSLDRINTSPQVTLALLRQLVYDVGVDPCNITVGDTLTRFPNQYWDPIQAEFPGVKCLDYYGLPGRIVPERSTTDFIYWSPKSKSETVPTCFAQADYVINLTCLKGHRNAGVTICGKNHFGSLFRTPRDFWDTWDDSYLNLHNYLVTSQFGMGYYRPQVDLLGCQHFDGNAVLFLVDALFCADTEISEPVKWDMSPFGSDWPSSLFASQDPVAVDSVGFDFLWTEFDGTNDSGVPHIDGAEDYLHEAAEANAPASGTFYDPDGDGIGLASLGVHEHWNNAAEKLYSRNLGIGDGVELLSTPLKLSNDAYGMAALASNWLRQDCGSSNGYCDGADLDFTSTVDLGDFALFAQTWLEDTY